MMFHADSLAGFCSSASLWALSHTSRSIRLHFLRFAIGSVTYMVIRNVFMEPIFLHDIYTPYVTKLLVHHSFNRNAFPKLKHLRFVSSTPLNPLDLINITSLEWSSLNYYYSVPRDFPWPDSITSLSFIGSLQSYPPKLLKLVMPSTFHDFSIIPSSLTHLNSPHVAGPFVLPQCSQLTTLIANSWHGPIQRNTFPKTLTHLKLANFIGDRSHFFDIDCIVDCVPNLKILKVPRLQHLYEIPRSVIHLSIGLDISPTSFQPCFHFHTVTKKTKSCGTYWVYKRIPNSRSN